MGASVFQYIAPIVLGIISEKKRIEKVHTIETYTITLSSYIFEAWAPTPAAPKVFAIVFKIRIDAIDLFIFSLWERRPFPYFWFLFF